MISNYIISTGLMYQKQPGDKTHKPLHPMETSNHTSLNQLHELRLLVREELKDCSHLLWPKVCELQSTQAGRQRLEDMILHVIASDGIPVGSAIALVEQELAHIH